MSRIVVDLGNSRMKWGLVRDGRVATFASLDYDRPDDWQKAFERWERPGEPWTIASVSPPRTTQLTDWLQSHSLPSVLLTNDIVLSAMEHAGLSTRIENRQRIGIDRLLGILAGWRLRENGHPLIVVAVGTAMTVDVLTAEGVHEGGLILPGPSLMAKSLNDYTAQLPLVPINGMPDENRVGRETITAIQHGISQAILGTVDRVIAEQSHLPIVVITGGLRSYFHDAVLSRPVAKLLVNSTLILEGIRLATEPR